MVLRKKKPKEKEIIKPEKLSRASTITRCYKYFWGHVVPEITEMLENKEVLCPFNDETSLPRCALVKFFEGRDYCKRCSLFHDENDANVKALKEAIKDWEKDDLLQEE